MKLKNRNLVIFAFAFLDLPLELVFHLRTRMSRSRWGFQSHQFEDHRSHRGCQVEQRPWLWPHGCAISSVGIRKWHHHPVPLYVFPGSNLLKNNPNNLWASLKNVGAHFYHCSLLKLETIGAHQDATFVYRTGTLLSSRQDSRLNVDMRHFTFKLWNILFFVLQHWPRFGSLSKVRGRGNKRAKWKQIFHCTHTNTIIVVVFPCTESHSKPFKKCISAPSDHALSRTLPGNTLTHTHWEN